MEDELPKMKLVEPTAGEPAQPPAQSDEGTPAPAPTPPPAPAPVPAPVSTDALLSPNVNHSETLARENQIKIDAYDLGIITAEGELDGLEKEAQRQIDKINADAKDAIDKINSGLEEKRTILLRRIDDYALTKDMLSGSLTVRDQRRAELDGAARQAAYDAAQNEEQQE